MWDTFFSNVSFDKIITEQPEEIAGIQADKMYYFKTNYSQKMLEVRVQNEKKSRLTPLPI